MRSPLNSFRRQAAQHIVKFLENFYKVFPEFQNHQASRANFLALSPARELNRLVREFQDFPRGRIVCRSIHPVHRFGDSQLAPPDGDAPRRSLDRERLDRPVEPVPGLPRLCPPGGSDQAWFGCRNERQEGCRPVSEEHREGRETKHEDSQRSVRGHPREHHGQHDPIVSFPLAFPLAAVVLVVRVASRSPIRSFPL